MTTTNAYSAQWFKLFMPLQTEELTAKEVTFLARQLPLPRYRRVLDLCCGYGRHALGLAALGYAMTGLDRDAAAIIEARRRAQAVGLAVEYILGDARGLAALPDSYDAIINMWQSLSYFDDATNVAILRAIHGHLTPGGRFVIDSYNRAYFENHLGERDQQIGDISVHTSAYMIGNRYHCELTYRDATGASIGSDHFDWRIYSLEEFNAIAADCGFTARLACSWVDEAIGVTPAMARMQITLERA
jgi:SAM-dependent methyltransferase